MIHVDMDGRTGQSFRQSALHGETMNGGSRIGHSSVVFKKQYGYRDGLGLITASAHLIH